MKFWDLFDDSTQPPSERKLLNYLDDASDDSTQRPTNPVQQSLLNSVIVDNSDESIAPPVVTSLQHYLMN